MTPEQYLKQAEEFAAASCYEEATAYASLATATAALAAMQAATPPALYPGEHAPPLIEWCGKCHAPGRRVKFVDRREQVPCTACSYDARPEVRPCRYCQTFIQTSAESRGVRNSTWTDSRGSRWCSEAPDPAEAQEVAEEADLTPEALWLRFLEDLYGVNEPQSTDRLIQMHRKAYYFPVTRYDQIPAPEQMDRWLEARVDQPYVDTRAQLEYRLVKSAGPDGEAMWAATQGASAG